MTLLTIIVTNQHINPFFSSTWLATVYPLVRVQQCLLNNYLPKVCSCFSSLQHQTTEVVWSVDYTRKLRNKNSLTASFTV